MFGYEHEKDMFGPGSLASKEEKVGDVELMRERVLKSLVSMEMENYGAKVGGNHRQKLENAKISEADGVNLSISPFTTGRD